MSIKININNEINSPAAYEFTYRKSIKGGNNIDISRTATINKISDLLFDKVTISEEGLLELANFRESRFNKEQIAMQQAEADEKEWLRQNSHKILQASLASTFSAELFLKLRESGDGDIDDLIAAYSNIYDEIVRGYEEGTREFYFPANGDGTFRKVTMEEEIEGLDEAFKFHVDFMLAKAKHNEVFNRRPVETEAMKKTDNNDKKIENEDDADENQDEEGKASKSRKTNRSETGAETLKSLFVGNLNMMLDMATLTRQIGQRKAMKIILDAFDEDKRIDANIKSREEKIDGLWNDYKTNNDMIKMYNKGIIDLKDIDGKLSDSDENAGDKEYVKTALDSLDMRKSEFDKNNLIIEKKIEAENRAIRDIMKWRTANPIIGDALDSAEEVLAEVSEEVVGLLYDDSIRHLENEAKENTEQLKELA